MLPQKEANDEILSYSVISLLYPIFDITKISHTGLNYMCSNHFDFGSALFNKDL